ncbi:D-arabinono-1,4-lactone oxidase [Hyalangium rubrum]|uniref:D-arabinono-1,4-lactone oxidase n=1 Tax=Hyalangium rubrum TaxID=3103134 RepID=A0ABU5HIP3_9BACT|nr:D-arabinono-1,4-lactone oxidase [Hyalangium sp. s54d21]MDY7233231.1 D-arabinono-1,4-lactone oxidase [Hyalangium sp. s54d21]
MSLLDKMLRIARTWSINTINSLVYLGSGGKRVLHEGRFQGWRGTWTNWSRMFECQPEFFKKPRTEKEICDIVARAEKVRTVGGGHSFNASPLTNGTLLSLDDYSELLELRVDSDGNHVARVQAGIRLRDLTAQLRKQGLALPVQGSTDAQSIGGLIATDVHGTGRDAGFFSTQLLSLRIVNAAGEAKTYKKGTPEFHAAIGGIGACGIVIEAEIQCVPAFNLRKSIQVRKRVDVEAQVDTLLKQHDHLSFYYIGGVDTESVRMNLWEHTQDKPSPLYQLRKMMSELEDMVLSGYLLGLARLLHLSKLFANFGLWALKLLQSNRSQVLPSNEGFPRRLYFHHDELEYGVPFENHRRCLHEILEMLKERRFVTILELRFTPDTSQALLAPGAHRRTCYFDLTPSLSTDPSEVFAEAERILVKHGGQVHLGKATWATQETMKQMYGKWWSQFLAVRRKQDPKGKFINDFVGRLLAGSEERTPVQEAEEVGMRAAS